MKYLPYDPTLFEVFAVDTLEEAQKKAREIITSGEMDNVLIVEVSDVLGIMEKVSPVWVSNKEPKK